MATEARVIPALMDVLSAARVDADKELRHLRALTTKEERTLRRYEKKENYPPGAEIDDLVSVYSEATGISVFDLWDEAIDKARKSRKSNPRRIDPKKAAGAAEKALREHRPPRRQRQTGS